MTRGKVEVCAHRGGALLSPENTLGGILYNLERIPIDRVDMDVCLTRDHQIILSHDLTLSPALHKHKDNWITHATEHIIKNMTYEELKAFKVGSLHPQLYGASLLEMAQIDEELIPRLTDVIERLEEMKKGTLLYQIELKSDPLSPQLSPDVSTFAEAFWRTLEPYGIAARCEIQSFDLALLLRLKDLAPSLTLSLCTDQPPPPFAWMKEQGLSVWSAFFPLLSREAVAAAHQAGLKVAVWTVNEIREMEQCLAWEVDSIITDHPSRLCHMLSQEKKGEPPAPRRPLSA